MKSYLDSKKIFVYFFIIHVFERKKKVAKNSEKREKIVDWLYFDEDICFNEFFLLEKLDKDIFFFYKHFKKSRLASFLFSN